MLIFWYHSLLLGWLYHTIFTLRPTLYGITTGQVVLLPILRHKHLNRMRILLQGAIVPLILAIRVQTASLELNWVVHQTQSVPLAADLLQSRFLPTQNSQVGPVAGLGQTATHVGTHQGGVRAHEHDVGHGGVLLAVGGEVHGDLACIRAGVLKFLASFSRSGLVFLIGLPGGAGGARAWLLRV